jgi:DNA-binding protein YbaB
MFGKMKDMYNLQKQAKAIKKELKGIHIEAEVNGIVVTMNAEMEVLDIKIPEENLSQGSSKLSSDIKEALIKARKKAESVAAEKMQSVMGSLGLGA